jgi:ribosomal protein S21
MMEVTVIDGNIDRAIQGLKKLINRDGIFRTLKDRQEPKPSVRRRSKERKALRRFEKRMVRRDG